MFSMGSASRRSIRIANLSAILENSPSPWGTRHVIYQGPFGETA